MPDDTDALPPLSDAEKRQAYQQALMLVATDLRAKRRPDVRPPPFGSADNSRPSAEPRENSPHKGTSGYIEREGPIAEAMRQGPENQPTEEKAEVRPYDLSRLQSAVRDYARAEAAHIAQAVIEALRSRSAEGVFDELHARHLWDEYCWARQEGPFDDAIATDDTNFGSIAGAFDGLIQAHVEAEVEKQPKHAQVFLSALAAEEDPDADDEAFLGCIWIDGIVTLITEAVNERAYARKLRLIGPDRVDFIRGEVEGTGFVWSMLDGTEARDLVSAHVEAMIDRDGDLFPLADEMVEALLSAVRDDDDGATFQLFLEHFGEKVRSMLREDALADLQAMRTKLLAAWDG